MWGTRDNIRWHLPSHTWWPSPSCSCPLQLSSHLMNSSYLTAEAVTSDDLSAALLWDYYSSPLGRRLVWNLPSRGRCLLYSEQRTGEGCQGGSRSIQGSAVAIKQTLICKNKLKTLHYKCNRAVFKGFTRSTPKNGDLNNFFSKNSACLYTQNIQIYSNY